jgi:hypothetical protein
MLGPALHALPSKTQTVLRLLPAASNPPITYSLPPRAAAADSSSATGRGVSIRWPGGAGDGDGERDGDGEPEGVGGGDGTGVAAGCGGAAQAMSNRTPPMAAAEPRIRDNKTKLTVSSAEGRTT